MLPKDIYIDLGTQNTLVYAKKQGILLNQPSLIATNQRTKQETAGTNAKLMLGKTPGTVSLCKPLAEGVIKNFEQAKAMLKSFLNESKNEMIFTRSRILISLPIKVQKHEKECFRELAYEAGAGIVHLTSEPLAGAIGSGVNIFSNTCRMFLDLGAGTSEAIVTYRGHIVKYDAVRAGGDDIDQAIIELLRNHHYFSVGAQTAETIKKTVAQIGPRTHRPTKLKARGINLLTGLPDTLTVDSEMIRPAVRPTFKKISLLLTDFFSDLEPEVVGDIAKNGIVLFGGGSLVQGVTEHLNQQFGVRFYTPCNPLTAVLLGGARILDDDHLFGDLDLSHESA